MTNLYIVKFGLLLGTYSKNKNRVIIICVFFINIYNVNVYMHLLYAEILNKHKLTTKILIFSVNM